MKGQASAEISASPPAPPADRAPGGPATANCAQRSVTEASATRARGSSTWAANSQMPHDLARRGRGGGHQPAVLAQPRGGAIVHHMAILAQHQAIADAALLQRGEAVGVDEIEKAGRHPAPRSRSCRGWRHRPRRRLRAPCAPRGRRPAAMWFPPAPGNSWGGTTARPRSSGAPAARQAASEGVRRSGANPLPRPCAPSAAIGTGA
jgi:hypothetical protein